MAATIPADVLQYIGHMLKLLQKLMFLYGWESLISDSKNMDDETKNMLIMMIGVMVGVDKAGIIVAKLALGMSKQIEKKIAQKALTKTMIYPIVKKISAIAGAKMTKEIYAKAVAKAVPVLGGAVSGTLTYVTFKPMGKKLKKYLISLNEDTAIPPEYKDVDIIDIEV